MRTPTRRTLLAASLALFATSALACDDEPVPEETGFYHATSFIATPSGGDVDYLELGSTIQLRLHSNGTTSGTMFIPGGDEDGRDYTADLTGTWSEDDDQVEFQHDADTFIRDITWMYQDGQLSAETAEFLVVLTRYAPGTHL